MQHFTPVDTKILTVLALLEEQAENAEPLAYSFIHNRVKALVDPASLYSLKTQIEEIARKGKPVQLDDMRAGLHHGLKSLCRAGRDDAASTVISALRHKFSDAVTGLADQTLELCKTDITQLKEQLAKALRANSADKDEVGRTSGGMADPAP